MSKKAEKTVALTSLKSLGGAIPEFTMPVKVPRVDGTLADLSFTVKGLRRTEWAAARDAYIETLRSKEEAKGEDQEKFSFVDFVTKNIEDAAALVTKAAVGWNLEDDFSTENLLAMEDMMPGSLAITLQSIDQALFHGRVGN